MEIPLYPFFIAYLIAILIFGFVFLIELVHLWHAHALTLTSFLVTCVVASSMSLTLWFTWNIEKDVNWNQTFTIGGGSQETAPGIE